MNDSSRGFSLVEVIVGIAIIVVALTSVSQITTQCTRLQAHYVAVNRLETTIANIETDTRALLRYDGPTAQALQAGLAAGTFTVYQWEPDLEKAPVQCQAQHLTQELNILHIACRDRAGANVTRDIDLTNTQPFPGSLITPTPAPRV